MNRFPFLTLQQSVWLLRVTVAVIFLLHALMRFVNHTMDIFAGFLDSKGLLFGIQIVWCITIFEIAGGLLMICGKWVKWITLGFIILLLVGIILIHASLGWFVGEHGTGGSEYSVALIASLLVIAAGSIEKRTGTD